MSQVLNWGIIGTGSIAKAFARGLKESRTGTLAAVGSRTQASADKFADEFNVPVRHGSYEALLADPAVQAVYIATPHPLHAEWSIKAADAGKHVLCEKPLALNHPEATAVIEAARRNDVFLMEAFMYRCTPQTAKIVELIQQKAIGEVRVISATFSFHWPKPLNTGHRLTNNALGGGGILDVGCYCTSMARLVAGAATGKAFAEPVEVRGTAHIGSQSKVDEYAVASLKFPGGILAELSTGVQVKEDNVVRIYGSDGDMLIHHPWIGIGPGQSAKITVTRHDEKQPRVIEVPFDRSIYCMEADTVAQNIQKRQAPSPAVSWDDSLGNMRTLDEWRKSVGMVYEVEKIKNWVHTADRRPLTVRPGHNMKYGQIPGVDKPVSRLVLGGDTAHSMPYTSVLFDHYYEHGGNTIDTARIYGNGSSDRHIGQWIKNRGLREKIVIISKGAHTPFNTPADMTRQFMESLEFLQTDYVDIYMLHRDNPDVPVGEFIDVLNEHAAAGRIKVFGGSNWSIERVAQANEYAAKKGLRGFGVLSNQFSLARMVDPVWEGCIAASDPASRGFLEKTKIALLPWSSQARGFFVPGRAAPDKKEDAELVRCWYSEDNFRRLERANELAAKRGVDPIHIALAYVLNQPFPTFPLIGPRQLSETRSSLKALDVELTPQEVKWLNLEA